MIRFQNIGVPRDFQMENKTNKHKKMFAVLVQISE